MASCAKQDPTADKLMARQWPCNLVCNLCNLKQETAEHLILHCSFAREVWLRLADWTQQLVQQPADGVEIMAWWQKELANLPLEVLNEVKDEVTSRKLACGGPEFSVF
jgi:hypothetical protein